MSIGPMDVAIELTLDAQSSSQLGVKRHFVCLWEKSVAKVEQIRDLFYH
jgi:hypothetical protein